MKVGREDIPNNYVSWPYGKGTLDNYKKARDCRRKRGASVHKRRLADRARLTRVCYEQWPYSKLVMVWQMKKEYGDPSSKD